MDNKVNKYKTVDSSLIHENPYWKYSNDKYILPNGREGDYFYVNSRGSVVIIPQISENKFLLTKQYRYLNKKISIEFPGGGCQQGISEIENAKIELAQEVGYKSNNLNFIGGFNPCNGMTNEICSVYLAKELEPFKLKEDESEEIEIVEFSEEQIIDSIKDNSLWDGMSLAAWILYKTKKFDYKII